MYHKK